MGVPDIWFLKSLDFVSFWRWQWLNIFSQFFQTFSDICTPNPCKNNGKCKNEGNDTFICNGCDPGWTGQNCTESINDCLNKPCLNGGECIDALNDYTCTCPKAWDGKNCEIQLIFCKLTKK